MTNGSLAHPSHRQSRPSFFSFFVLILMPLGALPGGPPMKSCLQSLPRRVWSPLCPKQVLYLTFLEVSRYFRQKEWICQTLAISGLYRYNVEGLQKGRVCWMSNRRNLWKIATAASLLAMLWTTPVIQAVHPILHQYQDPDHSPASSHPEPTFRACGVGIAETHLQQQCTICTFLSTSQPSDVVRQAPASHLHCGVASLAPAEVCFLPEPFGPPLGPRSPPTI